MKRLTLAAAVLFLFVGKAPDTISYRFEEVRSKVLLVHGEDVSRVGVGDIGAGGDAVRTGWLGHTVVSADQLASRFEIYSGSHVLLSSNRPGVLVKLERGRLKALFDALTGNDERLVETPGALLAVRGTRYGLEVDRRGDATLSVFEGTVEVRPFDRAMSTALVEAGQICEIRREGRVSVRRMPRGMTERSWGSHGASSGRREMQPGQRAGDRPHDPSGEDGSHGDHGNSSDRRRPH